MSQVGQEEQGLGQSNVDRRTEDLEAHLKGAVEAMKEIGKLSSDDPAEAAKGLKAYVDLTEHVFSSRPATAWTQEQKWDFAGHAADILAHARGAEAVKEAVTGVFEPRPVQAWTPEQRGDFMKLLQNNGLIPPTPSTPTPPVGGTPVVGK